MKRSMTLLVFILIGALAFSAPVMAQGYNSDDGRMEKQKKSRKNQRMKRGMGKGKMGLRQGTRLELFRYLYPVQLIRKHSADLQLTDKQIEKLQNVVGDIRNEIERLKWDVERESQKLIGLVKKNATKEHVYKQMDRVFKFENKIKKKHLGLMIVVKDILTPKQREHLDTIKKSIIEQRDPGLDGPGGPNPPPF